MEKNGIYICAGQNLKNNASGITKKILNQIKILENTGYNVQLINISNQVDNKLDKIKFILPGIMSSYEKKMIALNSQKINWENISFVYIRKMTFCKGFIKMIKNIRKKSPEMLIFLEVPTYPLNGEYRGVKIILRALNFYYSKSLKKYIDYIITYSDDDFIWGIKTIRISNAVDFNIIEKKQESKSKDIHMIAVAKFDFWHGYDRLLKGIRDYYENYYGKQGNVKVYLYLVGDGPKLDDYKKYIKSYSLEKYVKVEGEKYGAELDEIYNKCNIAIDALGRHRSKVFYNSSLKGKEYGAKGLPIVSGVKTELDGYQDYLYYMRVEADDSPVNIKNIIKFYNKVYSEKSEAEVIDSIRNKNKKYFEINSAFYPVIRIIKEGEKI